MAVDFRKDVDYVAGLARLRLSAREKEQMAGQLSDILEAAGRLGELDTEGVKPTSHIVSRPSLFREDIVRPSLPLEMVLGCAPKKERGYFRVPRIASPEQEDE